MNQWQEKYINPESSGQYCGGWDSLEVWEGWWSYIDAPTHWMPLPPAPNGAIEPRR